jgi:hypothetical protein
VYPHIGDFTNLAGYPPLKQQYHLLCLPLPKPIIEYGSSIQGRSQDGAKVEDFQVSLQRKNISSTYLLTVYFGTPSMFITLWFGFDYGTNPPLGTLII